MHDLDLDSITLILKHDLDMVKMYHYTKNQVSMSTHSKGIAQQTDIQTHTHTHDENITSTVCAGGNNVTACLAVLPTLPTLLGLSYQIEFQKFLLIFSGFAHVTHCGSFKSVLKTNTIALPHNSNFYLSNLKEHIFFVATIVSIKKRTQLSDGQLRTVNEYNYLFWEV